MISIGTDIVDVKRFESLKNKHPFLQKVFTAEERRYCQDKKNAAQHFAVRFAAKEAVWKALSSAKNVKGLGHKNIWVDRKTQSAPKIRLGPRWKPLEKKVSVSLSHCKEYAVATAIYQE